MKLLFGKLTHTLKNTQLSLEVWLGLARTPKVACVF